MRSAAFGELSRIRFVYLPTYAPWLNPIEKLWDWLKADVLKMHRLAGQWDKVKQRVAAFLDDFADASDALLPWDRSRERLTGEKTSDIIVLY